MIRITNKSLYLFLVLITFFSFCNEVSNKPVEKSVPEISEDQKREILRKKIENDEALNCLPAGNKEENLHTMVRRFYKIEDYKYAWFVKDTLKSLTDKLVNIIERSEREGLDPQDYNIRFIRNEISSFSEPDKKDSTWYKNAADLEILLTSTFLTYASHLFSGRINPEEVNVSWYAAHKQYDLAELLKETIEKGELKSVLEKIKPSHEGYRRLQLATAFYNGIAEKGGWNEIHLNESLKKGMRSPAVYELRKRLALTDDLDKELVNIKDSLLYDENVIAAVKKFQDRHGLKADGITGGSVIKALNVPAEERFNQLSVNLERWRWVPANFGEKYVFVNVPAYELKVMEKGKEQLGMKIIVGKTYNSTPVFSDIIEYVVFNPYWNIPKSIAVNEVMPKMKNDSTYSYLQKNNMQVVNSSGNPVSPSYLSASNYGSYWIRQKPGPSNPLGQIKFMFPNPHAIYLHDTPAGYLFDREKRAFSHGCIRIEQPVAMAEYMLKERLNRTDIIAKIKSGKNQTVYLNEQIPVHIMYFTSWVDEEGKVHFREDLYGHDREQVQALQEWVNACKRK